MALRAVRVFLFFSFPSPARSPFTRETGAHGEFARGGWNLIREHALRLWGNHRWGCHHSAATALPDVIDQGPLLSRPYEMAKIYRTVGHGRSRPGPPALSRSLALRTQKFQAARQPSYSRGKACAHRITGVLIAKR